MSIAEEATTFTFARNFFRNPRMLGSVIPSSRWLVDQLLRHVDWDKARVIVEYGPGVGTISRQILKRMHPDATLVTIELNGNFAEVMRRNFTDSRLRVVHRSAADVNEILAELGLGNADYVIAGIPFSIMSDADRHAVLRNAYTALKETGVMLIYQFSGKVKRDLAKLFPRIQSSFEPRNILPARVFVCSKV